MTTAHRPAAEDIPLSYTPLDGWHCNHIYYSFDRTRLKQFDSAKLESEAAVWNTILPTVLSKSPDEVDAKAGTNTSKDTPERLQVGIVAGHKADFSIMMMDPDPIKLDSIHQRLLATDLGSTLSVSYSFVSISELSEYVPTIEQYGEELVRDGAESGTPMFQAKLKAYEQRLPIMNRQRLTPDFPSWPASCFYPMNKKRKVGENWFLLPFSQRKEMMSEHARSGIKFMGKVTQLITVGVGLEDWEWGVTLWAKNPAYLTHIVYQMRFDEASARYAEFGPFFTSYPNTIDRVLRHCLPGKLTIASE
jgi:hydrogen peroxide-dependent heme synthase